MEQRDDDIQELLEAVAAGNFDVLTPENVDRLAAHLNASPEYAAMIADARLPVDPRFQGDITPLNEETWERVWRNIEAGEPHRRALPRPRLIRLWQPFAAVAASVALTFALWSGGFAENRSGAWPVTVAQTVEIDELETIGDLSPFGSRASPDWPVAWAQEVAIDEIEVTGDVMPIVVAGGHGDLGPIIWMPDTES